MCQHESNHNFSDPNATKTCQEYSHKREYFRHLNRRFEMWQNGDFLELFDEETSANKKRLPKSLKARHIKQDNRTFRDLMEKGKVNNALRFFPQEPTGGVLGLDDTIPIKSKSGQVEQRTTHDILAEKHPIGKPASVSILLPTPQDLTNSAVTADGS